MAPAVWWWWLGALLIAGIGVRAAVSPYQGFFGDLQDFVDWGNILNLHFHNVYSYGAHRSALHPVGPPPAFPPPALYIFALIVRLHLWARALTGGPAGLSVAHVPQLAMLMKLPSILADAAVTAILFGLGRNARGYRWGLLIAALWMLSPVGIFAGALWGQIDVLPVPFLILSMVAAARRRHVLAGLLLGLGMLWKPQALIFLPLILVYVARWSGARGLLWVGLAAGGVALLGWLPYFGSELVAYQANLKTTLEGASFTPSAYNLWVLIGLAQGSPTQVVGFGLRTSILAWFLFAAAGALILVRVTRTHALAELLMSAGLLGMALFVLGPFQHERYIVQALPFILAASAAYGSRVLLPYLLTSVAAFANIALSALASLAPGERVGPFSVPIQIQLNHPIAYALALAMMLLLALTLQRALKGGESKTPEWPSRWMSPSCERPDRDENATAGVGVLESWRPHHVSAGTQSDPAPATAILRARGFSRRSD